MKNKFKESNLAIKLRKSGMTYKEILEELPISKASLSLWFKDLPFSAQEKKVLKKRKNHNITKGRIQAAAANRKNRLNREKTYLEEAKSEFDLYCDDPLFHTGVSLYWAEGAKRNEMFHFMNSDEKMIEIMLVWLEKFTDYNRADLGYRLYLHQPFTNDGWENWWQRCLGVDENHFKKTIIKPSGLGVKKRPNYKGCLRVEVPKSSKLLIKTKFWINMLVDYQTKR